MKKKIIITAYDLEIGGIEKSLVNMLENIDYERYEVDLFLYKHEGELFKYLDKRVNLLPLIPEMDTFGKPVISLLLTRKYYKFALRRIEARIKAEIISRRKKVNEKGYYQSQIVAEKINKYLPKIEGKYDLAISYCWPHYFTAEKIDARKKIAWIHTDYSNIYVDRKKDLKMWEKFQKIISVSNACTQTFLKTYQALEEKILLIENITSPEFVRARKDEKIEFDKASFNIVSVGRLCNPKGFDRGIEAMKILKDKNEIKNIKWYIIGFGPDEEKLKKAIEINRLEKEVILLGKKENPYPYISQCDLYMQPSRYEGKAVTVTEAQILGKAVLLTDYPTASNQVTHLEDGYITENSVFGIVDGIETLCRNEVLRKVLQKNCRKRDYSNFKELEKLYRLID